MKKLLIVNADDFGLEEDINFGIIDAYRNGVVTAASLMANGAAFEHAVALSRENEGLDIGAHLTLTRGPSLTGEPVLDSVEVPSLVRGDNLFPQNPVTLSARTILGFVSLSEVERELRAQMERIRSAGVRITHVDSHQHIHMVPPVFRVVAALAREFNVGWLRLPKKRSIARVKPRPRFGQTLKGISLSILASYNQHIMRDTDLQSADYYLGLDCAGHLVEATLEGILRNLPAGTTELSCHPGSDDVRLSLNHPWRYKWQKELEALGSLKIRETLERERIELTSYSARNSS